MCDSRIVKHDLLTRQMKNFQMKGGENISQMNAWDDQRYNQWVVWNLETH